MNPQAFKILFAGGGTGGHLYSGIAVAEQIRKRNPQAQILFVGTPFGLEKEIVPKAGFSLQTIKVSPLKGSGLFSRLRSILRLPGAYLQSKRILKAFQPHMVIGIGGYASGPVTLAAHFSKARTAVIEQNSYPGLTNRILGRFVDRVFVAFSGARRFFPPKKTYFTGNPVRAFSPAEPKKEGRRFTLFILGGSQGAHRLNVAMMEAVPSLRELADQIHFIHQTGKNDYQEVREAYLQGGLSAEVFAYIEDVGSCYARSDLVLCRAGAGTITELRLQGLPAILVPYPFAADDHQWHNAKEMADDAAAEIILNKELNGRIIAERLHYYRSHPKELVVMGEKAKGQAKPEAAREVWQHCLEVLT